MHNSILLKFVELINSARHSPCKIRHSERNSEPDADRSDQLFNLDRHACIGNFSKGSNDMARKIHVDLENQSCIGTYFLCPQIL
jgi:hypothetical protein